MRKLIKKIMCRNFYKIHKNFLNFLGIRNKSINYNILFQEGAEKSNNFQVYPDSK